MEPASVLSDQNKDGSTTQQGMQPAPEAQPAAAVTASSDKVASPEAKPTARLCHLVIRPDFVGYGFKLLEDTERKREIVDSVEPGSPAEAAGLRVKDVIIEVNGAKVEGASHQDILDRIMSIPNETRLLVADDAACRWNREHGVTDSDSLPMVVELSGAEAADQSASEPASRQAGVSPASSTPSVAAQVADREVRQQSVERADPDRSGPDLPISTPDKKESSMSRQQEPDSLVESTLQRRTAAEGTQPRSDGTEPQVAAQVAGHEGRQQSVERTDPDRSGPNLPISTSNKDEPFMNSQKEPDSLAESTLRRGTAAERTQPRSDGTEHKVAAQVADHEVRQKSVESTDPDRRGPNLPSSTSNKDKPFLNSQQEPDSLAKSTLRRQTAVEGTQPRSDGTEPQVAAQVADHEVKQQSVERTDPNRSGPNLPISRSNKDEPFTNNQKEPDSLAEGTLRRRTATEGTQPKSDGTEYKDTSTHEPAPAPDVAVAQQPVSRELQPVQLPPLDALELTVRLLIPLRLPLGLLLSLIIMSLLVVYYLYAYINRRKED